MLLRVTNACVMRFFPSGNELWPRIIKDFSTNSIMWSTRPREIAESRGILDVLDALRGTFEFFAPMMELWLLSLVMTRGYFIIEGEREVIVQFIIPPVLCEIERSKSAGAFFSYLCLADQTSCTRLREFSRTTQHVGEFDMHTEEEFTEFNG
jgi:hypothetical protein